MDLQYIATQLMELFQAKENFKGVGKPVHHEMHKEGDKVELKYTTEHSPYTLKDWILHVEGKIGLGLIPVKNSGKSNWASIDIDDYGMTEKEKFNLVSKLKNYPLNVTQSKSKGFHAHLILQEEVPAVYLKSIVTEIARRIGHGGAEIFPKQVDPEKIGNFLNMPYFGEHRKAYRINKDKLELMTAEEFIREAEVLDPDEYKKLFQQIVGKDAAAECNSDMFKECPYCLDNIFKYKPDNTQRNNTLYQTAVYLNKRFGEVTSESLRSYNELFEEPLSDREINTLAGSVNGKEYNFKCCDDFFQGYCNPTECSKRKYGVGIGQALPTFTGLVKVRGMEEPLYIFYMEEKKELHLNTEQLLNYNGFKKTLFEQHDILAPDLSKAKWEKFIRKYITNINYITAEEIGMGEISFEETVFINLLNYIENTKTTEKDQALATECSYQDSEYTYFCIDDFRSKLLNQRIISGTYTKKQLAKVLDNMEFHKHKIPIEKYKFSIGAYDSRRTKWLRRISTNLLLNLPTDIEVEHKEDVC